MNARPAWIDLARLLVLLVLTSLLGGAAPAPPPPPVTQVLVVGTIHQKHHKSEAYSEQTLARILQVWDPAAVCVEIRPQEFRRELYLSEMTLATIWGLENGRAVYPIDWWSGEAREERERLRQTEEHQALLQEMEQREAASPVWAAFTQKYGEDWYQADRGPEFWNGADYNGLVRDGYRISVELFGDSPENLYYLSRNAKMLEAIEAAVAKHPGERVVVLTGAEHKHYFDDALGARPDVEAVPWSALPELPAMEAGPQVRAWLDDATPDPYFDLDTPEGRRSSYRVRMRRLVHGPDMDARPWTVPQENIAAAGPVLEAWAAEEPDRPEVLFRQGWLALLRREPAKALPLLQAAEPAPEDWWRDQRPLVIAICHDLLGQRAEAIAAYEAHIALVRERLGPMADDWINEVAVSGLQEPFTWPQQ